MTAIKTAIEAARGDDKLWAELDKIVAENPSKPPENSFCQADIRERYHIDRNAAEARIRKMKEDGIIVSIGRFGNKMYYQLVK
jgi:hypothetical protein